MCTVTLVPHASGIRMMCNRDERRNRARARPPERTSIADRTAVFPVDPEGGGTWIGVNDAGVAVALLNRPEAAVPRRVRAFRSRGGIVTRLLRYPRLSALADALATLDAGLYRPFQIVAVQERRAISARSIGGAVAVEIADASVALMFTSSSVQHRRAEAARQALFADLVVRARGNRLRAQAHFHRHRWLSDPEISVDMARPDARTVSRTTVDHDRRGNCLTYESLDAEPHADCRHVCL